PVHQDAVPSIFLQHDVVDLLEPVQCIGLYCPSFHKIEHIAHIEPSCIAVSSQSPCEHFSKSVLCIIGEHTVFRAVAVCCKAEQILLRVGKHRFVIIHVRTVHTVDHIGLDLL